MIPTTHVLQPCWLAKMVKPLPPLGDSKFAMGACSTFAAKQRSSRFHWNTVPLQHRIGHCSSVENVRCPQAKFCAYCYFGRSLSRQCACSQRTVQFVWRILPQSDTAVVLALSVSPCSCQTLPVHQTWLADQPFLRWQNTN